MTVQMSLSRIFIREMTDLQFIELEEVGGGRAFPIVIGLTEAMAIERRLKGRVPPRPQTHDLLATAIDQLGGTLERIVIHTLKENTFFAKLIVTQDGKEIEIDSRPSDAIAIAAGTDIPIYVDESVLEEAGPEDG
ncbi:MAG: bifunctional nuclease family protein [Planctomycetes bacterium]|nr:bifunctional nuclease family protein [Planctomycetota bacterium]NOG55761.1 bifunctional nuclease family protein [Planctomycetota bacterium]